MKYRVVKLNEVALVFNGKTPSKAKQREHGLPILKIKDVSSAGEFKGEFGSFVDEEFYSINGKKALKQGDTLFLNAAHNSDYVGSKNYYAVDELEGVIPTGEWLVVRPEQSLINSRFLFYYLTSERGLSYIKEIVKGIHLYPKDMLRIPVILPPLEEQKRIAQVLDKADRLRQKDRQLLAQYDQLLQSVFLGMFGDPVNNEKGWEVVKLGELGKWQSGGTPSRSNSGYFKGTIPWLSSGELNEMYVSSSKECITEEAVKNSNAKLIEPGSILLGMYDTAALKSTITTGIATCNQAIAYAKLDSNKADTVFIYYVIQQAKEHYKRQQRGVRQKNLNLSMVKNLEIILPPLEMQQKFSSTLELIDSSRDKIKLAITTEDNLFQSLLQKAFKGELQLKEEKPIAKPKFIISSIL